MLNDHEKNLIQTIDEQVITLKQNGADNHAILNHLLDFVPEVLCLISELGHTELLSKTKGFPSAQDFIEMINQLEI